MAADRAGQWLRDCLNPERAERLQPSQLFHLLKLGREHQVHGPCAFILENVGYTVTPVEPEDEKAALERAFIESVQTQRRMLDRIEKLTRPPLQAAK